MGPDLPGICARLRGEKANGGRHQPFRQVRWRAIATKGGSLAAALGRRSRTERRSGVRIAPGALLGSPAHGSFGASRASLILTATATCLIQQHRGQVDADIRLNDAEYRFGFEAAAAGERASRVRLSPKGSLFCFPLPPANSGVRGTAAIPSPGRLRSGASGAGSSLLARPRWAPQRRRDTQRRDRRALHEGPIELPPPSGGGSGISALSPAR
jgi:hypothetical protein